MFLVIWNVTFCSLVEKDELVMQIKQQLDEQVKQTDSIKHEYETMKQTYQVDCHI